MAEASLGTSTTSVCTGVPQNGLGGLATAVSLGQVSGDGSMGGISDLIGYVAPSVGTASVSARNLSDFAATGGRLAVIGVGDFCSVGGASVVSNVDVTGVLGEARRHSTSSHQPLQLMPSTGSAITNKAGPHLPPGTWNTRL